MANLNIKFESDLHAEMVNGKRVYTTPRGDHFPSVTTILQDYNKAGLQKWRDSVGEVEANRISKKASTLGTGVHNLCEKYIKGEPLTDCTPFELARFKDIKDIIDKRFGDVYAIEAGLYSYKLKLAGRCDIIGQFDGINSVIDFKTSRKPKKLEWITSYFLQTSAYGFMFAELTKDITIVPKQLVIVITVEHEDPQVFVQPLTPWFFKLKEYLIENYPAFELF